MAGKSTFWNEYSAVTGRTRKNAAKNAKTYGSLAWNFGNVRTPAALNSALSQAKADKYPEKRIGALYEHAKSKKLLDDPAVKSKFRRNAVAAVSTIKASKKEQSQTAKRLADMNAQTIVTITRLQVDKDKREEAKHKAELAELEKRLKALKARGGNCKSKTK